MGLSVSTNEVIKVLKPIIKKQKKNEPANIHVEDLDDNK
jgi:hypothetical protein